MEPVAVLFRPAVADILAVVHVGDHDVAHAVVGLPLRLPHRRAHAAHDQHHARRAGHQPLAVHLFHVLDVDALACRGLEEDDRVLRARLEAFRIRERERRHDDAHADLEAAARSQPRELAAGEPVQQLAHRREHALLLDADRGIAEARGELERIDAVGVDDAVDVDVADVALVPQRGSIFLSVALKILFGSLQNIGRAHLAGRRPDVAGKQLLVLEVDADRRDELPAVEERAGRDLHAHDPALQLELPDPVRPGALVVLEHLDHVLAVLLLADEKQPLQVLRLAARLDDVAVRIRAHERDRVVEGREVLLRDDRDARRSSSCWPNARSSSSRSV